MQKKGLLIILVAIIAILAVIAGVMGWMFVKDKRALSQQDMVQDGQNAMPEESAQAKSDRENGIVDYTRAPEVWLDMRDSAYSKPNIRIKKGTKVIWTNQDAVGHNVMKMHDDGNDDKPRPAPTKEEVKPSEFEGPLLAKGESYSFVFNEAGSFPYYCAAHPFMKGIVTVVE